MQPARMPARLAVAACGEIRRCTANETSRREDVTVRIRDRARVGPTAAQPIARPSPTAPTSVSELKRRVAYSVLPRLVESIQAEA